ncbi:MFS transporter [Streptomyces sp. N2-109]|uniref:MFS transporter n=1 Tax=Streptomyces gossypii TaxID=2883101 RepID=A0ABT2JRX8_9ACTN|nr:MFS transporter [Streptomyces gossypii]MCT2590640.1 MFS transporter [Streptomyces gossypii]
MPSPYREIFAAPGSRRFSAAGFLGRMTLGMLSVGIVTMVSQLTGRYGLAGALAATVALSVAVCSPQVSRLVDRHGQRRVLRPAMLVSVTGVAGLVLCARQGAPDWLLFVFAAASGCTPGVGSMVRARWTAIHGERPQLLHSAFAFESVVDEACFVLGPILSIGLCTVWFAEAGPVLAAGFLLTGVLWLSSQHATEPVPHPHEHRTGGSALRTPGLWVLAVVYVFTGAVFGSVDVVTVAFAEHAGHKALAGPVLGVYALGSVLAGALYGLRRVTSPAPLRWLVGICAMALSMIPLQLVGNLPWLMVALFVAGLTVAPTMVTTVGLVQQLVPGARLTEGMTWLSTGLAVGIALGSSTAGWGVDTFGAERAYGVSGGAGALAAAVAFLGYRRLRPPRSGGVVEHERTAGEEQSDVA